MGLIFTALVISSCVVSFKIGPELVKVEQQDFLSMMIINNVSVNLY